MIRVLLADDQALIRAGFHVLIDAADDLEVVGEATDGAQAVHLARRERADVVLMDIRMPGMDGLEATRLLTGSEPAPKVVMLTTFDLDEYVYEALRAGAKVLQPLKDQFYGERSGGVLDCWGNHWYIATHLEDLSMDEIYRRASAGASTSAS